MSSPIQKYAFVNAQLRARLSRALGEQLFAQMIRANTLSEAIELLRGTPYEELAAVYSQTGDLKSCELALFRSEVALCRELKKELSAEVKELVVALQAKYEISVLKNVLRLWFDRTVRGRHIDEPMSYLYHDRIEHDLKIDQLLAAPSIDEVVGLLHRTPYEAVLASRIDAVKSEQSLFPIEVALDQHYYRQLMQAIGRLDRRDASIAGRIIGVEIDILNITWITRFKRYYDLPLERTVQNLIPHGRSLKRDAISSAYAVRDPEALVTTLVSSQYPQLGPMLAAGDKYGTERLILIERILEQILTLESRRLLAGYPFTVGIILAYFVLRQQEIRKIMTLLNAKYYGMAHDRITEML